MRRKLLVLAMLNALPQPAPAQQPARFPAALDGFIKRVIGEWQLPGLMIAVVRNDTVVAARGYGAREIGKPALVHEQTVFDAASITKSFTAAAIAMLVAGGTSAVRRTAPKKEPGP